LAADWLWLHLARPLLRTATGCLQGKFFRNNQLHLSTLYDNGSQIVNNTFADCLARRHFGIAVSRNVLIATNTFPTCQPASLLGDDPAFRTRRDRHECN
jgi:hypothetical protein